MTARRTRVFVLTASLLLIGGVFWVGWHAPAGAILLLTASMMTLALALTNP